MKKMQKIKIINIDEKNIDKNVLESLEKVIEKDAVKRYNDIMHQTQKWHEKTFTDAKLSGQLLKLEEELKELEEALNMENTDNRKLEIADVLIVCAGLRRFKSKIGCFCEKRLFGKAPFIIKLELVDLIKEKMKINRARKWDKLPDGRFKHQKSVDNKKKQ